MKIRINSDLDYSFINVKGKRRRKETKRKTKRKYNFSKTVIFLMIAIVIISSYFLFFQPKNSENSELKAAILDSLYVMDKNLDFLHDANQTLTEAGFEVDVYLGENVTVELFKTLPSLRYKLIILRVHTAYESDVIAFFTGTPAGSAYGAEQMLGWVRIGKFEESRFYAVTPDLFLIGTGFDKFNNSIVIVDSCFGLNSDLMASAFIEKGASAFLAWDQGVYSNYSDNATLVLINNLVEGMTIAQAIENTPVDHDFGSVLQYFPSDAGYHKLV